MGQQQGESVAVKVRGETTGEDFEGAFRVKTRLTHGEHLERDRVRRELLGAAGGQPEVRAREAADMLSQLHVRVTSGPGWWTTSADDATGVPGTGLYDDNVLVAVYNAVMAEDVKVKKAIQDRAEAARKELVEGPTKD